MVDRIRDYEAYLKQHRPGLRMEEARPEDIVTFTEWYAKRRRAAQGAIRWAVCSYYRFLGHDGMENEVLFLDSGGRPCTVDPALPMPIRGLRGEVYRTGAVAYENDFRSSPWIEFLPQEHVDMDNLLPFFDESFKDFSTSLSSDIFVIHNC